MLQLSSGGGLRWEDRQDCSSHPAQRTLLFWGGGDGTDVGWGCCQGGVGNPVLGSCKLCLTSWTALFMVLGFFLCRWWLFLPLHIKKLYVQMYHWIWICINNKVFRRKENILLLKWPCCLPFHFFFFPEIKFYQQDNLSASLENVTILASCPCRAWRKWKGNIPACKARLDFSHSSGWI